MSKSASKKLQQRSLCVSPVFAVTVNRQWC